MSESLVHKAAPVSEDDLHCDVCGQVVRKVPGGQGPTWIHADSGAVAAPSPRSGVSAIIVNEQASDV